MAAICRAWLRCGQNAGNRMLRPLLVASFKHWQDDFNTAVVKRAAMTLEEQLAEVGVHSGVSHEALAWRHGRGRRVGDIAWAAHPQKVEIVELEQRLGMLDALRESRDALEWKVTRTKASLIVLRSGLDDPNTPGKAPKVKKIVEGGEGPEENAVPEVS